MAKQIKLPDLGSDVEEVTITRWLVSEGDQVEEGDILLEIATDKVDTEVPAPFSGTIGEIKAEEGELVAVDAVLAYMNGEGDEASAETAERSAVSAEAPKASPDRAAPSAEEAEEGEDEEGEGLKITPVARRMAQEAGVDPNAINGSGMGGRITKKDVLAHMESVEESTAADDGRGMGGELADAIAPEVKRLAAEHNVNLRQVAGDRPLSTLTREDVLNAARKRAGEAPVKARTRRPQAESGEAPRKSAQPPAARAPEEAGRGKTEPLAEDEEFVPHSRIRLLTARNTQQAAQTIPHVTTWWDVNMSRVLAHRQAHKAEFAGAGVKLTVTAYMIQATVAGLKAVPEANSTWTEEGLILKRRYHIGMAVALPGGGLIVPVIKNAGDLSLMGVARQVNDLAQRARANKLKLEELQGGTFTVTNYGTSGSRFQTPVIVQGQAGILGVGAIEKRPLVVSQGHPLAANTGDYLTFAPILTLGLSYDHRILDGATADAVCAAIKEALETWPDD